MIKAYELSRKYIILFIHNNRYLPLNGLLTLLQWTIQPTLYCPKKTSWIFLNISEIFHEIYHEIFHAKKIHENLHHYTYNTLTLPCERVILPTLYKFRVAVLPRHLSIQLRPLTDKCGGKTSL